MKQQDFKYEETMEHLGWADVSSLYAELAQTTPGRQRIRDAKPLSPESLHLRINKLAAWREFLANQGNISLPNLPSQKWLKRDPYQHPFEREDLLDLKKLLGFWMESPVRNLEHQQPQPISEDHRHTQQMLNRCFDDQGEWSPNASPALGSLLKQKDKLQSQIMRNLESTIQKQSNLLSEHLIFERNGRKCLALKADFKGRIRGMVQDSSGSGRTLFLEPDHVIGPQNDLVEVEGKIRQEIWRIRTELTQTVLEESFCLAMIIAQLIDWDVEQALARACKQFDCQIIIPSNQPMHLINARHPFLDEAFAESRQNTRQLKEKDNHKMVPFHFHLGEEHRGLVLSGANTGGKTVTLKTVGLMAQLVRCGMPCPLDEGSHVPYYRTIFADIGDHQSLAMSLSTFASHLEYLKTMLTVPHKKTLVLLDELGSGTDPEEGTALARAIMEHMLNRGFHFVVTTHLQALCAFALTQDHMENGSMVFDPNQLRPTYRFRIGVPGRSHALEIASRAGMDRQVIERAKALISEQAVDLESAIRTLQEKTKHLEKTQKKLRKDEARLIRRIQKTKEEERKLVQAQETFANERNLKVQKEVQKAESKLRSILQEVKSKSLQKQAVQTFAKMKQELTLEAKEPAKVEYEASGIPSSSWQKGDEVYAMMWRKKGLIQAMDRKKVHVDFEGKIMVLDQSDIVHLGAVQKAAKVTAENEFSSQKAETKLDLLGKTVEDAIWAVDVSIDQALKLGQPFLEIVHGHGTGALKKAIRSHLRSHPAKHQWETQINDRNDGATTLSFLS